MKIDAKAIRQLSDLLAETGLTEIEVAEGDQMIRVNKGGAFSGPSHFAGPMNISMPSDPTMPQAANTSTPVAVTADHPGAVSSPMVGTVYTSSEPGSPPFVKKGGAV